MVTIKKEIRLGNLIKQGTVVGIVQEGVYTANGLETSLVKWADVKCIPITRDLLESCGFKMVFLDGYTHFELAIIENTKIITNDSVYNGMNIHWNIGIRTCLKGDIFNNSQMDSLHHLQNLYFDLKRTDLFYQK